MGALRPVGAEAKRIEAILELVPKWEWAGYERLGKGSAYALGRENQKGFAPRTIAQQRRKAVDDYIAEVQAKTGKLITRTDIWKAAGYRNRTQFERWQRNDPRCTAAADRNIRQILQRKPPLKKN
jgi:hypothetical protein